MNNSDDNPYSPPSTIELPLAPPNEPREPSHTRPLFRVAAALLALAMIGVGVTSFFPVTLQNSIFAVAMVLLGCQFLFAAGTGRWFTFGGKTLG